MGRLRKGLVYYDGLVRVAQSVDLAADQVNDVKRLLTKQLVNTVLKLRLQLVSVELFRRFRALHQLTDLLPQADLLLVLHKVIFYKKCNVSGKPSEATLRPSFGSWPASLAPP